MAEIHLLPARRPGAYAKADDALRGSRAYATVLNITGPGDDVVTEEGPLTPAVEFVHRAPRYIREIIVITLCLGIGCFCIWEIVGIGADVVRRVVGGGS